jgi:uncharacterized protein YbjT (DUF2867 family)
VTVLVTGGTGQIGRPLVKLLRSRDVPVVVATRTPGPDAALSRRLDLATGDGLPEVLDGVHAVVALHTDSRRAREVDADGTARLAPAAKAAGVQHLLLLSIVGCDRVPLAYYRAKLVAEQAVEESGVGWTVQRATQFHTLVRRIAGSMPARGPVAVLPRGWGAQPVDPAAVVDRLAELVRGGPRGRVEDLAGPQHISLAEAARLVSQPRWVLQVPVPGRVGAGFSAGGNLPRRGALIRGSSFTEWLATTSEVAA